MSPQNRLYVWPQYSNSTWPLKLRGVLNDGTSLNGVGLSITMGYCFGCQKK